MSCRNIAPKCEDVNENVPYALTIAPSDVYQYWASNDRLSDFRNHMTLLFTRVRRSCIIECNVECSPLGRLHIHGTIKIIDKKNFYLKGINELLHENTLCIKSIDDTAKWDTYCNKQSGLWGSLRSPPDIPISNSMYIYDHVIAQTKRRRK